MIVREDDLTLTLTLTTDTSFSEDVGPFYTLDHRGILSIPCRIILYLHLHQSLDLRGRWGTTDDFTTSFLHSSVLTCPLGLGKPRPFHSLMLSSHLFLFALPSSPFHVPCKMVLARPDVRETCPYHFSLCLFPMVRSSCGQIACWILA